MYYECLLLCGGCGLGHSVVNPCLDAGIDGMPVEAHSRGALAHRLSRNGPCRRVDRGRANVAVRQVDEASIVFPRRMVVHPSLDVWTDHSVGLLRVSLRKRDVELFHAVGVQSIEAVVVHGLLLIWRGADVEVQELRRASLDGAGIIVAGGHYDLAQV